MDERRAKDLDPSGEVRRHRAVGGGASGASGSVALAATVSLTGLAPEVGHDDVFLIRIYSMNH